MREKPSFARSKAFRKRSGRYDPLPEQLALVVWEDAYYDETVHQLDEAREEESVCILFSIGFYLGESKKYVRLAMDFGSGTCRHLQRILKKNVLSIRFIGEPAATPTPEPESSKSEVNPV